VPLRAGGLWWPSPEAPSRSPPRPPPSDPRRRSPGTVQICIRKNASINRNWNEMMEFPTVSCNDELLKLRYASVEGRHQGIQRCSGFVLVHLSLRSWMKQILLISNVASFGGNVSSCVFIIYFSVLHLFWDLVS